MVWEIISLPWRGDKALVFRALERSVPSRGLTSQGVQLEFRPFTSRSLLAPRQAATSHFVRRDLVQSIPRQN